MSDSDVPVSLYIAAYSDEAAAQGDWDAPKQLRQQLAAARRDAPRA